MKEPEFHVPPMPELPINGVIVVFRIEASDQTFLDRLEEIGAKLERTEFYACGIQFWIIVAPDALAATLSVLKAEKCNVLYTSAS